MSIQYMIRVGPGPKYKSDKTTKTSPIETTDEIFGNLTLIVETNTETQVRIAHFRLRILQVVEDYRRPRESKGPECRRCTLCRLWVAGSTA